MALYVQAIPCPDCWSLRLALLRWQMNCKLHCTEIQLWKHFPKHPTISIIITTICPLSFLTGHRLIHKIMSLASSATRKYSAKALELVVPGLKMRGPLVLSYSVISILPNENWQNWAVKEQHVFCAGLPVGYPTTDGDEWGWDRWCLFPGLPGTPTRAPHTQGWCQQWHVWWQGWVSSSVVESGWVVEWVWDGGWLLLRLAVLLSHGCLVSGRLHELKTSSPQFSSNYILMYLWGVCTDLRKGFYFVSKQ